MLAVLVSLHTVDGQNPAPPGMVKNPINNGIIIILGGAGFCPSTVGKWLGPGGPQNITLLSRLDAVASRAQGVPIAMCGDQAVVTIFGRWYWMFSWITGWWFQIFFNHPYDGKLF